jgi:hypothetical protein
MRKTLRRVVWAAAVLVVLGPPAARAQVPGRPLPGSPLSVYYYRQAVIAAPSFTTIGVQSSVTVPDRGTALLGGYGRLSEGRTEYGMLPGRGFRNVGYGRSATSGRISISARIIDLREEEFRQTGVRSR